MSIELKTIKNGLVIEICVITQMEKELSEFKKRNSEYYKKLMVFLIKISDVGITHFIKNPEKIKIMGKHRNCEILEIKTHGLRTFSIVIKDNKLVLLEYCKKKQNKYNKANNESLERAKRQIDLLYDGGIL